MFKNKPHLIVLTKTDLKPLEDIHPDDKILLDNLAKEEGINMVGMSNKSKNGIEEVKKKKIIFVK